jgi:hypothetical protein
LGLPGSQIPTLTHRSSPDARVDDHGQVTHRRSQQKVSKAGVTPRRGPTPTTTNHDEM